MKSTPLQIALAIPQLVLYGLIGMPMIGFLTAIVSAGIGTIVVLVGIVILALFGLLLFVLSRIEEERAAWTFDLDVPPHPFRTSTRTDGWKFPQTLLLQYADARTWLGVLHGAIISLLGLFALFALGMLSLGIAWLFSPLSGGEFLIPFFGFQPVWLVILLGILLIVLALLALVGLAFAHRALSKLILVPSQESELRRQARVQSQQRQQALSAADIERARIERDLHDGVQPRLVAVGLTLGMARRKLNSDPAGAGELIDEAHESTKIAVTELRQLVRGFQPAVLQDRGLDAALSALIGRSPIPVDIRVNLPHRYSDRAEATMYFVVAESLANATKHANATHIDASLSEYNGLLYARIADNGRGGAHRTPGGGIEGVINRVTAAGGTYNFSSPQGGPTVIEVTVPCAS